MKQNFCGNVSGMNRTYENQKSKSSGLQRHLLYKLSKAARDYSMIEENDKVLVCHSGGKDSFSLLDLLLAFQKKSPVYFDLSIVCIDIHLPGFPKDAQRKYLEQTGLHFDIVDQDIFGTVKEKIPEGKNMCGLCSRLRRGAIYNFAEQNNITKIALGHHMDDLVETLFLNLFYGGKMKAMPPKLLTDNKKNIVIRPMAYIDERDLEKYSRLKEFPVVPQDLCGAEKNMQRKVVKEMLAGWKRQFPGRVETIFRSMKNIEPSQLADLSLFNFTNLNTR